MRTPLRIAVSANVLNVALEVFLVYGVHLGLIGSAWGTVTAQGAAAAWYAAASRRAAVRPRRPGRAEVTALLRDGHQLSVRTIALGVVPLTTTAIAARLGPVALGGQQIAMRVWFLLALALDALAVPAQVYVSSSLGAGDPAGAHRVGRRCLRLGLLAGIALGVVTAGLAFWAPALFTADPAIRHAATVALLVAALTQPMAALAFVLDRLILGLSDYVAMRRAMILAIAAYVPVAALVLVFHQLGLPGIWVALGLWLAARAALLGGAGGPSSARQRRRDPFYLPPRARPCDARVAVSRPGRPGRARRALRLGRGGALRPQQRGGGRGGRDDQAEGDPEGQVVAVGRGRSRSAGAARSARWSGRRTRWPARPGPARRRSGRWC